jgi:hypothetical protein
MLASLLEINIDSHGCSNENSCGNALFASSVQVKLLKKLIDKMNCIERLDINRVYLMELLRGTDLLKKRNINMPEHVPRVSLIRSSNCCITIKKELSDFSNSTNGYAK